MLLIIQFYIYLRIMGGYIFESCVSKNPPQSYLRCSQTSHCEKGFLRSLLKKLSKSQKIIGPLPFSASLTICAAKTLCYEKE